MKIGNRTFWQFFIERMLPAATGGYTSYPDQPDIVFYVHTIIYLWIFVVPILLIKVTNNAISSFLHPGITAFIWLVIKLIVFFFHKQFDRRNDLQTENFETITDILNIQEENPPPFGISPAIWRIRDQITDFRNVDIDTTVDNLIQQGYSATDLFHFFDIYQRGLINITNSENETENHVPTVPTTVKFCCCSFVITWTRKDLDQYFDRPISFIECIISPIIAFICGFMAFYNTQSLVFLENVAFFLSASSAQFALLKAPNPDSFSAIYQEKFTPFSRAYHYIVFQLCFALLSYLSSINSIKQVTITVFQTAIQLETVISVMFIALEYIFLIFPLLNAFGILGSFQVSLFSVLECFQMIFFGVSGSVTFYSAQVALLVSLLIVFSLSCPYNFFTGVIVRRLIQSLTYFFGAVMSTFAYVPFITSSVFENKEYVAPNNISPLKRFGLSLLYSFIDSVLIFVEMLFDFSGENVFLMVVSYFLIALSLICHTIIPQLMSRYPFKIWSEPFFHNGPKIQKYLKVVKLIEYRILVPITLGSIFRISEGKYFGFSQFTESLLRIMMSTYITTIAYRHLSRFGIVLALCSMSEMKFDFPLFHTYFYLIVIWLLSQILEKFNYVNSYSSLHSITSLSQLFILVIMTANIQFTIFSIVLSVILTSPLIPLLGSPIFIPSFSRPTAFWIEKVKYEPRPGDPLFYKVISDSLGDSLSNMVKNGYFPTLVENNFYLILDDYFNAILHIIETGHDYIVFQLRGLEVREQTLCHRNELNVVRNGLENLENPRVFFMSSIITKFTSILWKFVDYSLGIFGLPKVLSRKKMAFVRASTWSTWLDDLSILSYSVSANNVEQIFPDRESQFKIFVNLVRVLTFVLSEDDEIQLPDDFDHSENVVRELDDWFYFNHRGQFTAVILSVSRVLFNELLNSYEGMSFPWKLYKYFEGKDLHLSSYLWIPSTVEPKLIKAFRTSISLAVEDVACVLPDSSLEELSNYVRLKIENCHMLPESDPDWMALIDKRTAELETLRLFNDPSEFLIKFMTFKLCEQPFKIVKLNDELVRGIWAEQVVETVFVESDDRERGSIQFDMFTLRNIIAQSANPPAGYPEVICPVTFSFTH